MLNRFKKDGLVDTYLAESHNGPPRKYYKITEPAVLNISNR